jgi:hypothetical protein
MSKKVFISHSSVDSILIDIIIEFLNQLKISKDDIFCTKISGTLESGKDFVEQIKNNVLDSKVVIFLMSERFFLSYFCLAELGAVWALNQNILPIIVPPISTAEYNNTPLIRVQALNMGNQDFAKDFYNDLLRKNAISVNQLNNIDELLSNFNSRIKDEIKILRKDLKGFYIARLINKKSCKIPHGKQIRCADTGGICNIKSVQIETMWKLNGLLDIETDPNILEHWIDVGAINLLGTKIQFKLGDLVDKGKDYKVFKFAEIYPLP